ncbi:hypothetical protein F66182_7399 [Fusarium sp. NRRL 66182]|nr:hypothetical protein F66182_7399 [Fusarium sp. NRRL 66182]
MAEKQHNVDAPQLVADDLTASETFDDGDSALGSTTGSDATSLRSSILKYRQENGRTYHAYKDGYLQHHLFLLTFEGRLHAAPLNKPVHRVFDAGTGTGIWAIEFADEHPDCEVIGVDLSPIQPSVIPPNVTFYVEDLEEPWDYSTKFDYIFARFLTGSIRDWPKFFHQSFNSLNPGGTIELIDIIYPLCSDDGTLSEDSALFKWSRLLLDAFTAIGAPIDSVKRYKNQLEEAGFVNVNIVKRKWPTNRWPKDPTYKQIGLWANQNVLDALSALSLAVFTRPKEQGGQGWSNEELQIFLAGVRKDIHNPRIHAYWPIRHIWYSAMFSPENAEKALFEKGYVDWKDSSIGDLVSQLEGRRFAFLSRWGLNYCDDNVFNDARLKQIIEEIFGPCVLGHWLRYSALPDNIECYWNGGSDAGLRVLAVQHLRQGSKVEFFPGSHLKDLTTTNGARRLHETSRDDLINAGCHPVTEDYPEGGLIIRDARLFTSIKEGYAITWLFGKDDALSSWPKIALPNVPDLIRMIVRMETSHIRINFNIAYPATSNIA